MKFGRKRDPISPESLDPDDVGIWVIQKGEYEESETVKIVRGTEREVKEMCDRYNIGRFASEEWYFDGPHDLEEL